MVGHAQESDVQHEAQPEVPAVALVTSRKFPAGTPDDAALADALRARGVTVSWHCWDDAQVRWSDFDLIVLRSCWDYHQRATEFSTWIDRRVGHDAPLVNVPSLLRWNMHKQYLFDLAAAGVRIPATTLVRQSDPRRLSDILDDMSSAHVVIKPAVSASAFKTFRVTHDDVFVHQRAFADLLQQGDVLVQEYLPAIVRDGEWSVMVFGGRISHVVLKRAREGDFRVQAEFGGTASAEELPNAVRDGAEQVLRALPVCPAYLRIDGCLVDGRFVLMEAEMIEPSLFLKSASHAADRFAEVLLARIVGSAA